MLSKLYLLYLLKTNFSYILKKNCKCMCVQRKVTKYQENNIHIWSVQWFVYMEAVSSTIYCTYTYRTGTVHIVPRDAYLGYYVYEWAESHRLPQIPPHHHRLKPLINVLWTQKDVVYLGWPIAPSYKSPNAGVVESQPMSTAVHMEPK